MTNETEWVLVPREPTEAMKEAAYRKRPFYTGDNHAVIYKTMLSAAPLAPSIPDAGVVKEWYEVCADDNRTLATVTYRGDHLAASHTRQAEEIKNLHETMGEIDRQHAVIVSEQAKRIAELEADEIAVGYSSQVDDDDSAEIATLKADVERLTAERNHQHFCRICAEGDVKRLEAERDTARAALNFAEDLAIRVTARAETECDRATTAEAAIETARAALETAIEAHEGIARDCLLRASATGLDGERHIYQQFAALNLERASAIRGALPLPALPKTKGEGT